MEQPLPQQRLTEHLRLAPAGPALERIGESERSEVCDQLSAAYAAGRLDHVELDERLALAVAARTRLDLHRLVCDLARPAERGGVEPAVERGTVSRAQPAWSAADVVALVLLLGTSASIVVIMLMVSTVSTFYFFGAVVGGSLAFVAGLCAAQLWHTFVRRSLAGGSAPRER